jgi:hypothetical protein
MHFMRDDFKNYGYNMSENRHIARLAAEVNRQGESQDHVHYRNHEDEEHA